MKILFFIFLNNKGNFRLPPPPLFDPVPKNICLGANLAKYGTPAKSGIPPGADPGLSWGDSPYISAMGKNGMGNNARWECGGDPYVPPPEPPQPPSQQEPV